MAHRDRRTRMGEVARWGQMPTWNQRSLRSILTANEGSTKERARSSK